MQKLVNDVVTANRLLEQGWRVVDMKLHSAGTGMTYGVMVNYLILLEK